MGFVIGPLEEIVNGGSYKQIFYTFLDVLYFVEVEWITNTW